MVEIMDFGFRYPQQDWAVRNVSFTVEEGDFVLLQGDSGSGKSTVLKNLIRPISPAGEIEGKITMDGRDIRSYPKGELAKAFGYVSQNPDNQIVTDTVWHELAFSLENFGVPRPEMKRRIAETATYFGMAEWFDKRVEELSGGQKQILCLASAIVQNPKYLVLDEPLSQLDPVVEDEFLAMLMKLNREKNTAIVMAEHNVDKVYRLARKKVWLGPETHKSLFRPAPDRILGEGFSREAVREAAARYRPRPAPPRSGIIAVEELYYRYEKDGRDVLKDINADIRSGVTGIIGPNGSGKSTLASCLSGARIWMGKVKTGLEVVKMPQDIRTFFLHDTVKEDLEDACLKGRPEEPERIPPELSRFCGRHPYDLSGGEQQLLGFFKLLRIPADVYILDEPTRGMDRYYQSLLASAMKGMVKRGKSFLVISHDLEFIADVTEDCLMLFNGEEAAYGDTHDLLSGNLFYTTPLGKEFGTKLLTYKDWERCREKDAL